MTVPPPLIPRARTRCSRAAVVVCVWTALVLAGCAWTPGGEPLTVEKYRSEQANRADQREARVEALLESELQPLATQEERLRRVEARTETLLTELRQLEAQLSAPRVALSPADADGDQDDREGDGEQEGDAADEADGDAGGEPKISLEPGVTNGGEAITFGAVECIALPEIETVLRARVDSGAKTASLNAVDIEEFERDGDAWVRFRIPHDDGDDEEDVSAAMARLFDDFLETLEFPGNSGTGDQGEVTVEAEVDRRVTIIQSSGEESRPVVRLPARIGPLERPIEFTLSDRRNLEFPALIGRRVLRDMAVVDVGREFVHPCQLK